MKIAIGSDEKTHVTDWVINYVKKLNHEVELFGPLKNEKKEWAEVSLELAEAVANKKCDEGILFCWTGIGASIAANKMKGIRAALCIDSQQAKGARKWNHANILVMSLRLTTEDLAKEIIDAWFNEPFGKEDFDIRNVKKINQYEKK